MHIGTMVNYSGGFNETVAEVAELEKAGLDIIFVPEAYSFDAVSQLGFLAAKTSTIKIASGIFQIYTRTPSLTAMTAAGLDYVSDGRFVLGLGASGPQVVEGFHGVKYDAPIARTREVIDICRQVWRREKVQPQGKYYQIPLPAEKGTGLGKPLKLINHPVRERIPVVIAALGPKNVELTAEIAEGWQPIFYYPEKAEQVWGEALAAGKAKRAPPSPSATMPKSTYRGSNRISPCTSAAWAQKERTSTTISPSVTATKPRPRRSRTSTSPARRRKLPLLYRTNWCGQSTSSDRRASSRSEWPRSPKPA